MLDIDEMKQKWAEHDRKLDQSIRLNRQILCTTNLDRARSVLQRVAAFLGVEALVWFAIVMALADFTHQHAGALRLALPAAALDLYAVGMLAATVRQIVAVRQIGYDGPIAAIQQQLEMLRVLRIRMTQWGVMAGAVVWAPLAIVASKAVFGIETYSAAWLWANVVFGLSLIPLVLWLSRRFSQRMGRSPFIQRLMKDLAGYNLTAARNFLAIVAEFENETLAR